MLHVGRMAEEYEDELEKDFEESLSPSLSSKQYILEIFILISFRRTYRILTIRGLILRIWREKCEYNARNFYKN